MLRISAGCLVLPGLLAAYQDETLLPKGCRLPDRRQGLGVLRTGTKCYTQTLGSTRVSSKHSLEALVRSAKLEAKV